MSFSKSVSIYANNTTAAMKNTHGNGNGNDTDATAGIQDMLARVNLNSTTPPTSTLRLPKILTLDISGCKFKVSRDILEAESGLFALQLSGRFAWQPEADGSYFLDADPELFGHLVRFMRRPQVYPLFYDRAKGFDYDLYNRLQVEAEYFQMDSLAAWIKANVCVVVVVFFCCVMCFLLAFANRRHVKNYLQAVKTVVTAPYLYNMSDANADSIYGGTFPVNKTTEFLAIPRIRKSYVCPRAISCHMGDKLRCGAACSRAQGNRPDEYEDEHYTQVMVVEKQIVFDSKVCQLE